MTQPPTIFVHAIYRDTETMLLAIKGLQMLVKQVVNVIKFDKNGHTAAAHELFNRIRQVAPICASHVTDASLGPESTQPKRHFDQPFLHNARQSVVGHTRACTGNFS